MSAVNDLRRRTLRLIQADPVQIRISRQVQASRPAGGIAKQEVTLEPQPVRLYLKRGPQSVVQPQAVGVVQQWGLLGLDTADMKPGDEFEARGRKFRVLITHQETFRGEPVGISAEVEEVGPDGV